MRSVLVHASLVACAALAGASAFVACRPSTQPPGDKPVLGDAAEARQDGGDAAGDALLDAQARAVLAAAGGDGGSAGGGVGTGGAGAFGDGGASGLSDSDPMSLHRETREELLTLFTVKDFTEEEKKRIQPDIFLRSTIGVTGPERMHQGNKAIAMHTISREKCLAGLKDIVIQTPEQKAKCGADNMVPVWTKGKDAWFCIDVFEFPNKACELPFVWTPPTMAKKVCELQGKRLCSDHEWNIACRGDPEGGPDRKYAYGDRVDIDICHTNRRHRQPCIVKDAKSTYASCTTDTEPSGSFPACRSRFGVFDQHGNVAEVMMRREGDQVFTQLKGSAWFYNELVREPGEPVPETTTNKQGAYPDHCNFDPRWHVEKIEAAWHVNYHLGFRCCKSIP